MNLLKKLTGIASPQPQGPSPASVLPPRSALHLKAVFQRLRQQLVLLQQNLTSKMPTRFATIKKYSSLMSYTQLNSQLTSIQQSINQIECINQTILPLIGFLITRSEPLALATSLDYLGHEFKYLAMIERFGQQASCNQINEFIDFIRKQFGLASFEAYLLPGNDFQNIRYPQSFTPEFYKMAEKEGMIDDIRSIMMNKLNSQQAPQSTVHQNQPQRITPPQPQRITPSPQIAPTPTAASIAEEMQMPTDEKEYDYPFRNTIVEGQQAYPDIGLLPEMPKIVQESYSSDNTISQSNSYARLSAPPDPPQPVEQSQKNAVFSEQTLRKLQALTLMGQKQQAPPVENKYLLLPTQQVEEGYPQLQEKCQPLSLILNNGPASSYLQPVQIQFKLQDTEHQQLNAKEYQTIPLAIDSDSPEVPKANINLLEQLLKGQSPSEKEETKGLNLDKQQGQIQGRDSVLQSEAESVVQKIQKLKQLVAVNKFSEACDLHLELGMALLQLKRYQLRKGEKCRAIYCRQEFMGQR